MRDEGHIRHKGTGRKEISARSFLKPFPQGSALRQDAVIKGVHSLAGAGVSVYLVGGVLRDLAIGRPPERDYDFVLEGDVRNISEQAARRFRGTSFLLDKDTLSYRVVVKPRGREPGATLDFSPVKGGCIVEDLMLRDFTVNALAVSLQDIFTEEGPFALDPAGGIDDAGVRLLRSTGKGALKDDPLRALRALRLAQCCGLEIGKDTLRLISRAAPLLSAVSRERIRDELALIFSCPGAPASVELIYRCGMAAVILPAIAGWEDIGGYALKSHSMKTLEEAERIIEGVCAGVFLDEYPELKTHIGGSIGVVGRAALLKLAAFLHDAGKPLAISRESGALRFIGHDELGAAPVKEMLAGLKFSRQAAAWVSLLVRNHHRAFMLAVLEKPSPKARAHFFRAVGGEAGLSLLLLALADARATRGEEDTELLSTVKEMLGFYYDVYTVERPVPLIDGREIMGIFNVPEGRKVGAILKRIAEGVEGGVVSDREEAIDYVKKWLETGGRRNGKT